MFQAINEYFYIVRTECYHCLYKRKEKFQCAFQEQSYYFIGMVEEVAEEGVFFLLSIVEVKAISK